jgi:hypothetical protein
MGKLRNTCIRQKFRYLPTPEGVGNTLQDCNVGPLADAYNTCLPLLRLTIEVDNCMTDVRKCSTITYNTRLPPLRLATTIRERSPKGRANLTISVYLTRGW